MQTTQENKKSWLDRPVITNLAINWDTLIFTLILMIAIFTRFYDLESRVMSHDENSHVYYSWRLSEGMGYQHTPLTHGPLLFHLTAASYFMFGDNDFTARIPFVLFNIATVAFLLFFRGYLGRVGTLVAAGLMLISPYMLYYARYVRNEALVGLFGVVTIWAILRYLENGEARYTYLLIGATSLHFATKETAFIYTAQALLFLGLLFLYQLLRERTWENPVYKKPFTFSLILALILLVAGLVMGVLIQEIPETTTETGEVAATAPIFIKYLPWIFLGLALLLALYFAVRGLTWRLLRCERSFSLMILLFTMVLPHLVAFPISMVGWDPMAYETFEGILRVGVFLVPLLLISIGTGLVWNSKLWLINAAIFYVPFTILFTTVFTNGQGFFTGLVGSLAYWLEQQGVERGSQPWYYYAFLQIPIYEFLPALGSLLAGYLAFFRPGKNQEEKTTDIVPEFHQESRSQITTETLTITLLGFWTITSLIAYTIAGEKMPWLTFHIALPMILLAGWSIGKVIERVDWKVFYQKHGLLILLLMIVLILSFSSVLASLLGTNKPFQGRELQQLNATNSFLTALLVAAGCVWGVLMLLRKWEINEIGRIGLLTFLAVLGILTTRAAFRAAYINYDNAKEYLVYAHSASGPKVALNQIEELSIRTTDGLAIIVAYDDETTYPYWWYLRNYPNAKYYGANPTRELREAPVILVGDNNFAKIEPVVGQAYHRFDYIRIWWPDQDYYGMTWERIWNTLTNSEMRSAIFQIWYNRDYTKYAELKGKDMSLPNWEPSDRMRLYIRKDISAKVWNYGVSPIIEEEIMADPYDGKEISLPADLTFGTNGSGLGEFNFPRDVALAPDGSLYISDTGNHRIQHINPEGEILHSWGSFADSAVGTAPPGTFYEPWGIAVDSEGYVYVADTWNHRIQKFSAEGGFITQWGYFGQGESGEAFWGPRDIVIDQRENVLISDTGNKRVVVFDRDGNYLASFGSAGLLEGQFDEPVGLDIDNQDRIFVVDTWNQRVQVFQANFEDFSFSPVLEWEIVGWYGQSLDNKPYIAVDNQGNIFISDPEGYRILQFNTEGEFIHYWGDYGTDLTSFNLPTGLTIDQNGDLWVVDTGNHRIMHFSLPEDETRQP